MLSNGLKWTFAAFKLEWRNILSYRVDFWFNFVGTSVIQFTVAYFLWKSIFEVNQVDMIKGMTLQMIILYYILAPLAMKSTSGLMMRFMFDDIYTGGLNKYLLYPLSYIRFKLVTQFANTLFYLLQFALVFVVYYLFLPLPSEVHITFFNTLLFLLSVLTGSYLYFMLASIFEMISFWADNIWSLMVMLRFIVSLFGGLMLPLRFFPEWSQGILNILPFRYVVSFPMQNFFGQLATMEIVQGFAVILFWSVTLTIFTKVIWNKGQKQYSGIGI